MTQEPLPDVVTSLEPTQRTGLARYLRLERERMRRDPMTYGHPPHAQQEEILADTGRWKITVAANRAGKSEGEMRDVLWCCRGEHPYRRVRPIEQAWIATTDYPTYMKTHRKMFEKWCPKDWIVGDFHETDRAVDIRRADGGICTLFFLSYDMKRDRFQAAGVGRIWLDEEPPEDVVNECLARIVTTRGSISLSFTPVDGIGWWYDRIWKLAEEKKNHWHAFTMPLAEYDERFALEYNVGRSLVPHLTREQIIEFAREYPDPDEQAIRIFGLIRAKKGLVYKGYRAHVHNVPRFTLPAHWELWGAVDPGYHGFAAAVFAMSPQQRAFVVSEFFSQEEDTATRFRALAAKVRELRTPKPVEAPYNGPRPIVKLSAPSLDPVIVVFFVDTEDPQVVMELNIQAAAAAERDAAEHLDPVLLSFASLDQGLKARKAGFLRVQQVLAPRLDVETPPIVARPRPPQGEPMLYFFDDLYSEWQTEDGMHRESRLLWEIQRYSWKRPTRTQPNLQPDDADENSAAGAHAMAVLRYGMMARLGPPEEPKPSEREGLDPVTAQLYEDIEQLELEQLQAAGLA